jgi:hypothetical protein
MSLESDGGMILTGENRRTRRETCPSATLSTTNPTWIDQGANPGLRGERPATNDLSHVTALRCILSRAKVSFAAFRVSSAFQAAYMSLSSPSTAVCLWQSPLHSSACSHQRSPAIPPSPPPRRSNLF